MNVLNMGTRGTTAHTVTSRLRKFFIVITFYITIIAEVTRVTAGVLCGAADANNQEALFIYTSLHCVLHNIVCRL